MGPIWWRAPTKTWRTREDREIPYDQLDDGHLLAILRMLVRKAAGWLAADNARIVAADWPEEADDERAELFARDWRNLELPVPFPDLEALARSRGLDLTGLDDYGRRIQEVAEVAMLNRLPARCGECGRADAPTPVSATAGHKGLVDATLAKKDPLSARDMAVLSLVLARVAGPEKP